MRWGDARSRARRGCSRTVRVGIGAGALSLVVAAWSPTATAESCPVGLFVPCGPAAPPPTTTTTAAPPGSPAPTAPTTTSSTTTTSTTIHQQTGPEAAARLLTLLNAERDRAGLSPFTMRDDVTQIAAGWSAAMARAGGISHNDAYFTAETRRRLDARRLGENVARNVDVESAHRALMASRPHRANILNARFVVVGVGAEVRDGSWWITEDFLQPASRQAPPSRPSVAPDVELPRGLPIVAPNPAPQGSAPSPATDDGEVLAAGSAGPELAIVDEPAAPRDRTRLLATEPVLDRRWPAGLLGAGLLGLCCARALRRRRRFEPAEPPAPATGETAPGDDSDGDVYRQLSVIDAWARTLDDRWAALSECDRRIATQIIRRTADETLRARRAATPG